MAATRDHRGAGNQGLADRIAAILYSPVTAWLLTIVGLLSLISWIVALSNGNQVGGLLGVFGLQVSTGFVFGAFGAFGAYRNKQWVPMVLGSAVFAVGAVLFVIGVVRWLA